MLTYFPMPYPDESIYNIIGRYHRLVGNINPSMTSYELTGKVWGINYSYIVGLNKFCSLLPEESEFSADYFINNHTVIPYYKAFLPGNKYNYVIQKIYNGIDLRELHIKTTSGFKYCPICINEDKREYGEAYIHRMHQVDGYSVCIKHNCMLKIYRAKRSFLYIFDDINKISSVEPEMCSYDNMLRKISANILELLHNNYDFHFEETQTKYNSIMHEKGYLIKSNNIEVKKLYYDFNEYYDFELLSKLNSLAIISDKNWLRLANHRPFSPMRNILFIRFLFGGIEEFITYQPTEWQEKLVIVRKYKKNSSKPKKIRKNCEDLYKNKLLFAVNTEHLYRNEIGRKYRKECLWLKKHFKEWLQTNLPEAHQKSYNWQKMDDEIYTRIKQIVDDINTNKIKERISMAVIIDRLNYKNLKKIINKLPKSFSLCENSIESIEQFHKRKIAIIISEMHDEKRPIRRHIVIKKAGIKSSRYHDYDQYIDELIESL